LAAGGVNHQTVKNFIRAGAVALGAGAALIPREFIQYRQADRIREFAPKLV
jgi:2-keto-3-deoxy-6-phosphogluconate aldolase